MFSITILWTLLCAFVILGYSIYLYGKTAFWIKKIQEPVILKSMDTLELLSFDIKAHLPSWSISLEVPQITEDLIYENPILFYLESQEDCIKLPYENKNLGYKANIYKNTGKVYVTFKSLSDGISNFHVPVWHLKRLKILILKSNDPNVFGKKNLKPVLLEVHRAFEQKGININDYEQTLGYLSNFATIDFQGHITGDKPSFTVPKKRKEVSAQNNPSLIEKTKF